MNKKDKFIVTSDQETYQRLLDEGFRFIGKIGNRYQFINQTTRNFNDDIDESKVSYTNMMHV